MRTGSIERQGFPLLVLGIMLGIESIEAAFSSRSMMSTAPLSKHEHEEQHEDGHELDDRIS